MAATATSCASSSWPTSGAEALAGADVDQRVREAMQRYVALLEALCREAPYNWFNFFDFWADDDKPAAARDAHDARA